MKRLVSIALLGSALLLFWLAGRSHESLRRLREAGRPPTAAAVRDAPAFVTFTTVALGGFRGLIADGLWVRASQLQDEGRYTETYQLAEWITWLEPRYTEVWAYHAWNMAYNISVMFPDPADRLRWVQNGLRLLRNEGIPANPDKPQLYWEVGWLYLDKIARAWDTAEHLFKTSLAEDMTILLGGAHPDYARINADPEWARRLREEQGLLPQVMQQVDTDFGPLDWRLPESQAVYWGYRGLQEQPGDVWCTRLVFQAIEATLHGGRLRYDPAQPLYVRGPRLEGIAQACAAFEAAIKSGSYNIVAQAYQNYLRDAVLLLVAFRQDAEAEQVYEVLRSRYPSAGKDPNASAFVTHDARRQFHDMGPHNMAGLLDRTLVERYEWLALDEHNMADGLQRLARLYWEAGQTSATAQAGASWTAIQSNAVEQAVRSLPEPLRERLRAAVRAEQADQAGPSEK